MSLLPRPFGQSVATRPARRGPERAAGFAGGTARNSDALSGRAGHAGPGAAALARVGGAQFIGHFLQHVLPSGSSEFATPSDHD